MYKYFICLLRAALNGTVPKVPPANIDWNQLYVLADCHSVAGTVYYGLMKLPEEQRPEADILAMFHKAQQIVLGRETAQHFELQNIMVHLDENNIDYLPLKGWNLKHLYPRPDMRSMCDVDILVVSEDMKKIPDIMKDCGFALEAHGENHDVYMNSGKISVEVHWLLFGKNLPYYKYFCDFMDKSDYVSADRCERKLSREDFYIHLIAHMAKHFRGCGTGVRSIMDIYEYWRTYGDTLDVVYIQAELDKLGLRGFAQAAEELAQFWFSENRNGKNSINHPKMAQHILTAGTYGCKEYSIASCIQEKNMSKAAYLLGRFFPKLSVMQAQYSCLNKVPYLLPLFWIVRGMRSVLFRRRKIKHEFKIIRDIDEKDRERMKEIWKDSGL